MAQMNSASSAAQSALDTRWIAADWGTSNLRVWAIDSRGEIAGFRASANGMLKLQPHEFEGALTDLVHSWLPKGEQIPVIACGMVGARQGWVDAGYRKVPCKPIERNSLVSAPTENRRLKVSIVPGLRQESPADVIRGEETQIAGYILNGIHDAPIACMPGTHSKWVRLKADRIESFQTFMTGEFFSLISNHSVVRDAVKSNDWRENDFLEAVDECLKGRVALAADVFGLRARSLISGDNTTCLRSRLSGLLIGQELSAMRNSLGDKEVAIIGSRELARPYKSALNHMGCKTKVIDAEMATIDGLKKARELSV